MFDLNADQAVFEASALAVTEALDLVVTEAVDGALDLAVWWAVTGAVDEVVEGAVLALDPEHPALQDFLFSNPARAGAEAG